MPSSEPVNLPDPASPDEPLPPRSVAPAFQLNATPYRAVALSELKGRPVILFFYPADWSAVCGDQAALYNQLLPVFAEYGATLVGISVDSAWSHQAFVEQRKLNFSLLSDFEPKGAVARQYGVYDAHLGVCKRALFVLDAQGVVVWSYVSPMTVNPGADGILEALDSIKPQ